MGESGFVKTDSEGVNALKSLARDLPGAVSKAEKASNTIQDVLEQNREYLGPHTNQIKNMLDDIDEAQKIVGRDVKKVQDKLMRLAAKLSVIISKDLGSGGN